MTTLYRQSIGNPDQNSQFAQESNLSNLAIILLTYFHIFSVNFAQVASYSFGHNATLLI